MGISIFNGPARFDECKRLWNFEENAFSFIYVGEKRLDSYSRDHDSNDPEFMGIYPLLFQIFLLSDDHYASISDERSVMDAYDGISVFITMHVEGEF